LENWLGFCFLQFVAWESLKGYGKILMWIFYVAFLAFSFFLLSQHHRYLRTFYFRFSRFAFAKLPIFLSKLTFICEFRKGRNVPITNNEENLPSISSTFFACFFRTNVVLAAFLRTYVEKKLPKWHSYEKSAWKTLMKLTPVCLSHELIFPR